MDKIRNKFWAGIHYVWDHPVILSPFLIVAAYLLFEAVRTQAFTPYMKCTYLLGEPLGLNGLGTIPIVNRTWTSLFCEGIDFNYILLHLKLNPLGGALDWILGIVRTVSVWAILLFFGFVSLLLTLIINNLKAVVRILTLNREEWKRFGASIVTFLLLFIAFSGFFYLKVVQPNLLPIRLPTP